MNKKNLKSVLKSLANTNTQNIQKSNIVKENLDLAGIEIFEDWIGIREHSLAPDEESYRKVGDLLAENPDLAFRIIQPLSVETSSTCKVSTAKALCDIIELVIAHKN